MKYDQFSQILSYSDLSATSTLPHKMTITEILLPTWKTADSTTAAWSEIQAAMLKAFSAFGGLQFSYGGNVIEEGQLSSDGPTARTVTILGMIIYVLVQNTC